MYAALMSVKKVVCAALLLLALTACGAKKNDSAKNVPAPVIPDDGLIHMLTGSVLSNFSYMITDPNVRRKLTDQGFNFMVEIRDGVHEFPIGSVPYDQVTLLNAPRAFGDLDGDQYQDAVLALQIGRGDVSVTELAMVGIRNGKPTQLASYSLGHTKLNAITINNRTMKVNVTGTFPGDPGPRNTEYTFALPPSAMADTGALRH